MKISFGLSVNKEAVKPPKDTAKVANIFSATAEAPKVIKRSILEITNGSFKEEGGPEESVKDEYVIPCKNSLEDLKQTPSEEQASLPKIQLKFGLNILNVKRVKDGGNAECAKDEEKTRKSEAPESDPSAVVPSTLAKDSDSYAANLIIKETNEAMLNDLFGITEQDLAEKASKTVPILLRKGANGDSEGKQDAKMYDKMPVENFGLAMLLGMGFDPKSNFKKPREYKKRVYERGGLGSDAAMKNNMDMLLNAKLMANVKSNSDVTLFPGLVLKVIDKKSSHYRRKGVVTKVCGSAVTLSLLSDDQATTGESIDIMSKYLETIVVAGSNCKVVRKINNRQGKEEIQVGSLVNVLSIHDGSAKVSHNGSVLYTSMDNICGFSRVPQ
ncbi:conserved hypothetical protein [Theileria equi strain WA]|uniref:Spp2/MOS2 G-patch domain-containing protein n=1 Tax=Theileria equi strain WA TaxID=1537102 RepID=L1LE52_THEEQ|nr:conserved hypothetical protein [Theileria equi strain WA]EKX73626.1 conserved hypothetical protein [Theileria equi strain WA]|eukprot:XP_004833078.1 conserved hypothetical protein [Theileria equi strain WA]